jgi:hypothetical protein
MDDVLGNPRVIQIPVVADMAMLVSGKLNLPVAVGYGAEAKCTNRVERPVPIMPMYKLLFALSVHSLPLKA